MDGKGDGAADLGEGSDNPELEAGPSPSESTEGAQAGGFSGHGKLRRLRFAHSLTGPYVAISAISMGKDLYMLEFGASANVIGTILLACSFISPMMDTLVGTMQDRGHFMARCFPGERWGRRAPWHLTHSVVLAGLIFVFFLPPSYDKNVLHAWFAMIWMVGYWCVSASINAFEAARVEIYPFKEERVNIEQYCKLTVALGISIGSGTGFMCLTFPSTGTFVAAGALGGVAVLSGLAAVGVMREANSVAPIRDLSAQGGAAASRRHILASPIVLRMLVIRALSGVYETVLPALQLYYLTFVFELDKETRLFWFGVAGLLLAAGELGPAPLWARLFSRSTTLMLRLPLALRLVDVVAAPLMVLFVKDIGLFMAYIVIWRIANAPFSYWKVAACAWVCDHDGGEREGQILGLFTMVTNLGRAVTSAVVVLGLGWAGMRTFNCLEDEGEALDLCESQKIHGQPASLIWYLQLMVGVVSPALELVICAMTYEFPIRPGSKMLRDLLKKQRHALKSRGRTSSCASQLPEGGLSESDKSSTLERLDGPANRPRSPQRMQPKLPEGRPAAFEVGDGPPDSPICEPPAKLVLKAVSVPRQPVMNLT